MIAIDPFAAEYKLVGDTGQATWQQCHVVGLTDDPHEPRFVVLFENDGIWRAMTVAKVRSARPTGTI